MATYILLIVLIVRGHSQVFIVEESLTQEECLEIVQDNPSLHMWCEIDEDNTKR